MGKAVDLRKVVGCSAFALAQYPEGHIREFIWWVKNKGYNTIRVLSETGGWEDNHVGYLPAGPKANTPAAKRDVRKLLRVAEEEEVWVELVSSGTIKHEAFRFQNNWARKVAKIASNYVNVFLNAVNEPQMSSLSKEEVFQLILTLRVHSQGRLVGVDAPCEAGHWRFPEEWASVCDWKGMHPRRNPDLTQAEIRNVVQKNGLVLFNETTCYVSDEELEEYHIRVPNALFYNNGEPTQGRRRAAARRYMRRFARFPNARWYSHSLGGLHCKKPFGWMPRWEG